MSARSSSSSSRTCHRCYCCCLLELSPCYWFLCTPMCWRLIIFCIIRKKIMCTMYRMLVTKLFETDYFQRRNSIEAVARARAATFPRYVDCVELGEVVGAAERTSCVWSSNSSGVVLLSRPSDRSVVHVSAPFIHSFIHPLGVECRAYHRCKKRFYVFYSGHVFTFFNVFLFCQRFLFLKTFIENTIWNHFRNNGNK